MVLSIEGGIHPHDWEDQISTAKGVALREWGGIGVESLLAGVRDQWGTGEVLPPEIDCEVGVNIQTRMHFVHAGIVRQRLVARDSDGDNIQSMLSITLRYIPSAALPFSLQLEDYEMRPENDFPLHARRLDRVSLREGMDNDYMRPILFGEGGINQALQLLQGYSQIALAVRREKGLLDTAVSARVPVSIGRSRGRMPV